MSRDDSKADLIRDLRAAMTGDMLPDTADMSDKYYDSSTGTLYTTLDGKRVSESKISSAARYFKSAAISLQKSGLEDKRLKAEYCELAADALEQLLHKS